MKKVLISCLIILAAFLALSCESDCCAEQEKENDLVGKWLLFERGWSPGAGYFIDPVSPFPPQQIEFKSNGELSCSVEGIADYNFYSVRGDIVGLFKDDPGPSPDSLAFTYSYMFRFNDGNLELWFRYCDEGCHLGFKQVQR